MYWTSVQHQRVVTSYKRSRSFTAECGLDGHVKSVLTRPAIGRPALHRAGQGRCLALLWTWLHLCPGTTGSHFHVHDWPGYCTCALRSAHRATLMGMVSPIMRALLSHEQAARDVAVRLQLVLQWRLCCFCCPHGCTRPLFPERPSRHVLSHRRAEVHVPMS